MRGVESKRRIDSVLWKETIYRQKTECGKIRNTEMELEFLE